MDQLQQLLNKIRQHLMIVVMAENGVLLTTWLLLADHTKLSHSLVVLISGGLAISGSLTVALFSSRYLLQPTAALWQAILHISPSTQGIAAPDIEHLTLGLRSRPCASYIVPPPRLPLVRFAGVLRARNVIRRRHRRRLLCREW